MAFCPYCAAPKPGDATRCGSCGRDWYPQMAYPAVARGTNGLAVASLVCAFLFAPLGLIFGLVAKSQIKRTGEEGDGIATAGIILSAFFTAIAIILLAFALFITVSLTG